MISDEPCIKPSRCQIFLIKALRRAVVVSKFLYSFPRQRLRHVPITCVVAAFSIRVGKLTCLEWGIRCLTRAWLRSVVRHAACCPPDEHQALPSSLCCSLMISVQFMAFPSWLKWFIEEPWRQFIKHDQFPSRRVKTAITKLLLLIASSSMKLESNQKAFYCSSEKRTKKWLDRFPIILIL